jgi:hypothetical protein
VPKQRAYSGSTDDTATPPRLPDSQLNLDLGTGGDDFGKMFDNLGKRASALLRHPSPQRAQQVRGTNQSWQKMMQGGR